MVRRGRRPPLPRWLPNEDQSRRVARPPSERRCCAPPRRRTSQLAPPGDRRCAARPLSREHGRTVDVATERKLRAELRQARAEFGCRHPDSLRRLELEDWRATLSPGARHNVFRAFRQALAWGLARGLVERDASTGIKNAKPKRHERRPIVPFESWAEIEALADELDPGYRPIVTFAAGTGLRPEEWIALERADVDREARVIHVHRRHTRGQLKHGTKTVPERAVPLRQRVLDALGELPPRIDTPLLFPAPRGGHIDIDRFRTREWYRLSMPPAFLAGARTPCATPLRPGRSRAALSSFLTSRRSWGQASASSRTRISAGCGAPTIACSPPSIRTTRASQPRAPSSPFSRAVQHQKAVRFA
jgi:integrase